MSSRVLAPVLVGRQRKLSELEDALLAANRGGRTGADDRRKLDMPPRASGATGFNCLPVGVPAR